MARYKQLTAEKGGWSDWERPIMRGYKLACCHCGLVHAYDFRVLKKRRWLGKRWVEAVTVAGHVVELRIRILKRETAQVRRGMRKEAAE